jgi:hypothetical protein
MRGHARLPDDIGTHFAVRPPRHPIVGTIAPEFRLGDGIRLGELMRDGRGIVLDFTGDRALRAATNGWAGRIDYLTGPVRDNLGFHALLIRPDGTVAWASAGAPDTDAFVQSATRWFGCPDRRSTG